MAVKRQPTIRRTGILIRLSCVCGSWLVSRVLRTDAIKIRDCFLTWHQGEGCQVTDESEDVE